MGANEDFELIEDFGIIDRKPNGWTDHFILAKWHGGPMKYEIRAFAPDGRPGKKSAMTPEALENLKEIISTL